MPQRRFHLTALRFAAGILAVTVVPVAEPAGSVTDQQIRLTKLQGKALSGSFVGDAQVDNWLHSIPAPPPSKSNQAPKKKPGPEMAIITAGRPSGKGGAWRLRSGNADA